MTRTNEHGHPIGPALTAWRAPPTPSATTLVGQYTRLTPLTAAHTDDLWHAASRPEAAATWTYLTYGPFADRAAFDQWVSTRISAKDPFYYAIIDLRDGRAKGWASHMRIDPANGVIEVGNVWFSPLMARGRIATEAMFLMMQAAFDWGYRRYEWKCDALNAPSRAAAARLGFSYEGIFRQAVVYKGRSRDTAWYAIIDSDLPALHRAFATWLDPANFDADGQQRQSLSQLTPRPHHEPA